MRFRLLLIFILGSVTLAYAQNYQQSTEVFSSGSTSATVGNYQNVGTIGETVVQDQASVNQTTNSAGFMYAAFLANINPGDPNGDGVVTNEDVFLVFDAIMGTASLDPLQILAADVNNDGLLDILDIILMVEMMNGT